MPRRRIWHRLHDRAWTEYGKVFSHPAGIEAAGNTANARSSISQETPWVATCSAFADGRIDSTDFRRNSAIREIVETVGPVDGRFYAACADAWGPGFLTDPRIASIDDWGNPLRWPAALLGTPRAFSPTTLRYLATALWLRKNGYVTDGAQILEIGVGFGGLAATNAVVSGATTSLVDLPPVENAALRMLGELGLGSFGKTGTETHQEPDLVISNYAFTELNSSVQQEYLDRHLRHARRGVIVSNSAVFASSIRGRSDEDLIAWLNAAGIPAKLARTNELLGPSDHICAVTLIHW
ncbi:MAG: hypothetical protein EOP88_01475 [Verrucomicrobiaceae bacterium]|nr:MAG: hypothetical protein EOP88_01475 [Verrucomicrobiaceae bacterium]